MQEYKILEPVFYYNAVLKGHSIVRKIIYSCVTCSKVSLRYLNPIRGNECNLSQEHVITTGPSLHGGVCIITKCPLHYYK